MTEDIRGARGDTPLSGVVGTPAQRSGAESVAFVPLGSARRQRRHLSRVRAVHLGALGCIAGLYLIWHGLGAPPLTATLLSALALAAARRIALHGRLRPLRRPGSAPATVLAVGSVDGVAALIARTRRSPERGWRVCAACTSTGTGTEGGTAIDGVPVVGDLDDIASVARADHLDAVAVGPAPGWTRVRLQQLAWNLDRSPTALLADPQLVGLVGSRMRVTSVPDLALLRLDLPTLTHGRRQVKNVLDRVGALLALVLVAPVLLSCTAAVRRDGGPALHRRARLGLGGREFALLTFRTTDATGALTPVGRVLRRHCLDELPQLLNVLRGSMALVGPRPPAPHATFAASATQRRLLVKPGITGLWQVVGDGDPYEDEAAELDLRYAESWTPVLDARILLRSLAAALRSATAR